MRKHPMQDGLFAGPERQASSDDDGSCGLRPDLGQFFTPTYCGPLLIARYFSDLTANDVACEPSCGPGAILGAIPAHVRAFGVEIDPVLAQFARTATGRQVVTGDFTTATLPQRPTVIIGNPPFTASVVENFMERAAEVLPEGGRVGFLLPVYIFQTPKAVLGYARRWSISQELLPRTIFPGLSLPILFAMFRKERVTQLSGFFLYEEADTVSRLAKDYQQVLNRAPRSAWLRCVAAALMEAGGRATLNQLYSIIGGRRPSSNPWWREQIRKVAATHFERTGEGEYALPASALAA